MEKKVIYKIFTILIVLLLILILSGKINLNPNNLSKIEVEYLKSKKTIVFTGQINYAPFEFIDDNSEYTGIMIDLIRWIATEFGFKARFLPQQFQKAQLSVLNGEADAITSLFYSRIRDSKFDFTQTVFQVPSSIFTYINRYDIQSAKDLNNKTISMQKGDIAEEYLKNNNIKTNIVYVNDFYEAVDKIIHFESDAVIGDEQVVWYHVFNKDYINKIKIVGKPLYIGKNCIAVKKGNRILLSILEKGIKKAKQQGILNKLNKKWIGLTLKQQNFFSKHRLEIFIFSVILTIIILILIFNNIYLRKKVQENVKEIINKNKQLKNSETKLLTLINSIPDIICFVDKNDYIVASNKAFNKLLNTFFVFNKDNLNKIKISQIATSISNKHLDFKEFILEFSFFTFSNEIKNYKYTNITNYNKIYNNNNNIDKKNNYFNNSYKNFNIFSKSIIRNEKSFKTIDNKTFYYDIIKVPVFDNSGNLINIISIGRDITEKKIAEKELLRIEKIDSIRNLASRFAHDFNNLLTSIIANTTLLQMETKNKKKIELLKQIELASESAKNISLQLLTFTKDAKTFKEIINPVELVYKAAELSLRGSRIKYSINLKNDVIFNIKADPNQLIQALNNVLINAEQAMPQGGKIEIFIENKSLDKFNEIPLEKNLYLIIEIKDHGIGMSEKQLNKIFEPFFTTKANGNGLGLYSVVNICKNHNGYIFVKSKKGMGTSFYLLFPSTGKIFKNKAKANIQVNKKYNFSILILDDEKTIHQTAKNIFEYFGCNIYGVYNDINFMEKLEKNKFDIVILDLILPNSKGGLELIGIIKEKYPDIITIVSSGYTENPAITNYKELGFNYFLKKPYTIFDVSKILDNISKKIG